MIESHPSDVVQAIVSDMAGVKGGLLPALQAIQHEMGYIDRGTINLLAEAFNVSPAEVHGVVSFYSDLRRTPPTAPLVRVCRGDACQARGGGEVWHAAQDLGGVEVEQVFCLGLCTQGPIVAVADHVHSSVSAAGLAGLVAETTAPASGRVPKALDVTGGGADPGVDTHVIVYVPSDAAARAAGSDGVAEVLAGQPGTRVVRNGSRGMLWLEPLVEVATAAGRIGYGPVTAADVPGLLAAGMLTGGDHPLCLGPVDQMPWMVRQTRFTFRRVGVVDPLDADDYLAHGGAVGLRRALAMEPEQVVAEVAASGLRGRGGAAFPTGTKWHTVMAAPGPTKYVVANADEGDSGSFADRMLMEGDPFMLLEGMAIAGWAVGAEEGYVYIRSEYPDSVSTVRKAVAIAEERGWLGADVLGSGFAFRVHVRVGAGAYICGEETALIESLEGKRGVVRAKPPLPAHWGLWGKPTVVNNVISLATATAILADGPAGYRALGTEQSNGTQVFQLAGNTARGGIFETPFGITLAELVDDIGGGTASGRRVRAAQIGGPLGAYLPVEKFDQPIDYASLVALDAMVGHGGIVVFDDTVDMAAQARFAMEFCAAESCGKCTPCRVGSTRGVELIDRIVAGVNVTTNIVTLVDLCELMTDGSLCALGGLAPMPVRSALTYFADDFHLAVAPEELVEGDTR